MKQEYIKITSRANPLICDIAKLKNRKEREEKQLFVFQGHKLFIEAVCARLNISYIFITDAFIEKYSDRVSSYFTQVNEKTKIITVPDSVFEKISDENSPEGILCVAEYLDKSEKKYTIYNNTVKNQTVILLDGISDPGNLGTIIRSCYAFGINELILSSGCCDLYSTKTVRAAMGALFSQNIKIAASSHSVIAELKKAGFCVYATALHKNSTQLDKIDCCGKIAFVIGNEGRGLSDETIALCDKSVIIPIEAHSESLNAAVAASVVMWEIKRQQMK